MPKNTNKRYVVNNCDIWTCACCNKSISTLDNKKLADTKIRLHKKTCKAREGQNIINEDITFRRRDEIGGGFNVGKTSSDEKIE